MTVKKTPSLAITYTLLEDMPLEDIITTPVLIKVVGRLGRKGSEEGLRKEILEALKDEGHIYFILDLTECSSISEETLKVIILEQWPLNPFMGRIMMIQDKARNPDVNKVFQDCGFYGDESYRPIFAFFNTVEQALQWIPKDRSRRLELRRKEGTE